MDFTLSPEIEDLRLRVRAFVEEHVLPLEADPKNFSEHENIPEDTARESARESKDRPVYGRRNRQRNSAAWTCRLSPGRRFTRKPARSIFGPLAFNCMAPDDGNMNLLKLVGTPRAEGKMAETYRRRQGAIDLHDDRTCAGRRLRSRR